MRPTDTNGPKETRNMKITNARIERDIKDRKERFTVWHDNGFHVFSSLRSANTWIEENA